MIAAVAGWWSHGGQTWMVVHTGTDSEHGHYYGYWSGFGGVFPWSVLTLTGVASGLVVVWRHVNCHERGCARVGRFPVAGGQFRYCGRHHPDWPGRHPPREHIHAAHHAWKRRSSG